MAATITISADHRPPPYYMASLDIGSLDTWAIWSNPRANRD